MGAGENALFEIFSTIYACPPGVLLVIDEIELGLHEKAQKRLMHELKKLCMERKIQVICTTHSAAVLDCVPPEARFLVERRGNETVITPGISSAYAAGRLAGENSNELDIYLEDEIAENLVQALLPVSTRRRVNLLPVGSAAAVIRQLAARYRERRAGECLAILDGDQRSNLSDPKETFIKALETDTKEEEKLSWLEKRITFLPGNTWPELWILAELSTAEADDLAQTLRLSQDELQTLCEEAMAAGKHRELVTFANSLSLPVEDVASALCTWVTEHKEQDFSEVKCAIENLLD
jgi:energy-coupling factor transporter ATP-binding protein EcfA2